MLTAASVYRRIRHSPWSFKGLVAGLTITAFLAGAGWAAHGGRHSKGLPPGLWNQMEFSSSELLVVFAVDAQGDIQPYHHQVRGKPAPYQPVQDPIDRPKIEIEVGNPKVCWKTSGGDEECVVY